MTWWHSRTQVGQAVTPTFLVGAGLLAGVTALFEVLSGTRFVGGTAVGGYLEFLLLAVPAVGLVYAGYWLRTAELDPDAIWWIGALAVGGAVLAAAVTVVLLRAAALPALEAEAAFVLFVGTSTEGSLLGVLAGTFAASDRRFRRERSVADELETLQALLRHDVRNRLTIIGGHLTKLTESADLPADSVEIIETQLAAIESVLADTGTATAALRVEDHPAAVDLVAVVAEQVAVLRDTYDDVEVRTDLPASARVPGDELLASVLDNLLSNAVQHHDGASPEIEVTATVADGHVRLTVADDGPGIPPGKRDQVFDPGVGEGTGMGLYLVGTIVDGYGGEVTIGDSEPGGTAVTLRLPHADDRF